MRWSSNPFVETRTFDNRLTKSALIGNTWQSDAQLLQKVQKPDFRQFKSTYAKESLIIDFLEKRTHQKRAHFGAIFYLVLFSSCSSMI